MDNPAQIPQILVSEWNLDASLHSKEEILAALVQRIGDMLSNDPVAFIQLVYRLDIAEARLDAVMDAPDAAPLIAQLVWDRQLQKEMMRKSTPPREAGDDDLIW